MRFFKFFCCNSGEKKESTLTIKPAAEPAKLSAIPSIDTHSTVTGTQDLSPVSSYTLSPATSTAPASPHDGSAPLAASVPIKAAAPRPNPAPAVPTP